MNRRTILSALGGLLGIGAASGAASAQDDGGATATPTPTRSDDGGPVPTPRLEAVAAVSPTVDIMDYRVKSVDDNDDSAVVEVDLKCKTPTLVNLADPLAGIESSGVATIPVKETTVPKGLSSVEHRTTVYDDEATALSLSTPGGAVGISTGLPKDKAPEASIWLGTSAGVTTAVGGTGLAAWRKYRDEGKDPESALKDDGGGLL